MTKEVIAKFKNVEIIATLLFELPKHGNDIIALYGNEDTVETYKRFGRGNRMLLKWNGVKFVKDKIYWEE